MTKTKIVIAGIGLLLALFILGNTISWVKVEGNEVAVRQHLSRGVIDEVWTSGTHFYMGWFWDIYKYDIGIQKITFDNANENKDSEYPRIAVEIGANGGQRAYIAISANYRLMASRIVELHKQGIGKSYEAVLLKREIVDIVNEIARPYGSALDIYSGAGFVDFKNRVEKALRENSVLKNSGIDIENTIVYGVHLDPAYEAEIASKQLAIQQNLTKIEQTKVQEQEAKRIYAESQSAVEQARQVAESKKIAVVKEAEAQAAEVVLRATAKRDADLVEAAGIIAKGEAEAKVSALKRESLYAGESGAWRAKVEIATAQAEKLKGVFQGVQIVPERTVLLTGAGTVSAPNITLPSDKG